MNKAVTIAAIGGLVLLAGCGTTPGERTTGGAVTGAASGAAVGALAGPVGAGVGALVGASAGAITGGVTSPRQINLGRPIWDNPNAHIGNASLDVGHGQF